MKLFRHRVIFDIVFSAVLFLNYCSAGFADDYSAKACFKERCFEVEIAQSDEERMRGLQSRRVLEDGSGMLFIFPESGVYSFWMKDTLIPLDMIWLDESKDIIGIVSGASPCEQDPCPTYGPAKLSRYVLEVNSGNVKRFHIQIGDRAEFLLPE